MAAAGSGLHRDFLRGAAAAGIGTGGAVGDTAASGPGPDPVPAVGWVVVVGAGTVVVVTAGIVGDGCGAPGGGFDPAPGPPTAWVVVVVGGTGNVVVGGTGNVVVVGTGTVEVDVGDGNGGVDPPAGPVAGWVMVVAVGAICGGAVGEVSVTDEPDRSRVPRPTATPRADGAAGRAVALSSIAVAVNPPADMAAATTTTATRPKRCPPMRYW